MQYTHLGRSGLSVSRLVLGTMNRRALDTSTLSRLDNLFPTPAPNGTKPAPEAYTW